MSYREVSVIEINEILRLWLEGRGLREVARLSGTDRKTVRRYVDRARACGLDRDGEVCQLSDELGGGDRRGAAESTQRQKPGVGSHRRRA
jgi:predicted DNA-binding transcriptional regulator YafY